MNRRIVFVVNSMRLGGAERHTVELARHLARCGWSGVLAYGIESTPNLRDTLADTPIRPVAFRGADGHLRAMTALARLIDAERPDVIYACNEYPTLMAQVARNVARARAPLVCAYHTHDLPLATSRWSARIAHRAGLVALGRADACVFVSDMQRTHWAARGLRPRRSVVIHNGVDVLRFGADRPVDRTALRTAVGVPHDAFVIACCAGLRREKRQDLVVDALALLRARGRNAHALFVGDGATRDAIAQRARACGLASHVTFSGFVHDVRPHLHAADAFLLPSDYEALPLALLEAMAARLPCVATRVGGVPEVATDRETALLIPRGDASAAAAALDTLFDLEFATGLAARAQDHVRAQFSIDAMNAAYESLLTDVARTPMDVAQQRNAHAS